MTQRVAITSVALLCNANSGDGGRVESLAAVCEQTVKDNGGSCIRFDTEGLGIGEQLERLERESFETLIAIGGDGTITAGAMLAINSDATLVIVPAGTMNLVAVDLDIHEAKHVVASLTTLAERRIDIAEVNGHFFLHSSLLGLVPALSRVREQFRHPGRLWRHPIRQLRLLSKALTTPKLSLMLQSGDRARRLESWSVAITNDPLREADADPALSYRRRSLDAGTLGVYASQHTGFIGRIPLLFSIALGRFARDPDTLAGETEALEIRASRRRVRVSLDGEVRRLDTPLIYRSHHRALKVGVPHDLMQSSTP